MRQQVEWYSHQNALWEHAARDHALQVEQLRAELIGASAERDRLASECERVAALQSAASSEIARLKAALQESRSALESATEARAWLEGEREKWKQAAQQAGARYVELEGKLKEAADATSWLEGQRSAWEAEATTRGEAAARWREDASRLQDAVGWAEEQRVAWARKASELEAELVSAQTETRNLIERRAALEDAVANFQLRLSELEGQLQAALRGLRQRRHEVALLLTDPLVRAALLVRPTKKPHHTFKRTLTAPKR
jgi:chromosome segregation ATPase